MDGGCVVANGGGSSKAQEGYLIEKTLRSFEMIGEMWRGICTTGCTESDAPCRGHRARPLAVSSGWRPRSGVNGSGRRFWVRLGGGCDSLVDHLLGDGWVQELAAEVLHQPQRLGGHGEAAPAVAGTVQDRPDQAQAAALAGEPTDHLGPAAGLSEGPFDEVGMADAVPVLGGEPQVDGE